MEQDSSKPYNYIDTQKEIKLTKSSKDKFTRCLIVEKKLIGGL